MNSRLILSFSSFLLATGIALGAFGAHALEDVLGPERLQTWETAVSYQMWNSLGLFAIGIVSIILTINVSKEALGIFLGVIVFSGSLYVLCLTNVGWFGAITPIGGTLMIIGWIVLGVKLVKTPISFTKQKQ